MPFFAHRCRRAGCRHPDYWSPAATYAGSVTRGMTVDGVPAEQWSALNGGKRMLRASCGMSGLPGHRGCAECKHGCDFGTDLYEVGQVRSDGSDALMFFAPGEETTGVKWPAGKIHACACDVCKDAYALRDDDVPQVVPALLRGSLRPVETVELPRETT